MNLKSRDTNDFRGIRRALVIALGALALLALPSLAAAKDRNHDRIPDRWEKRHRLSLKVKQTKRDQDRDNLKNLGEFNRGTNPRDADTDNDGLEDGDEVEVGDDPGDKDSDDDGVRDGAENAGTVASFDGTTLTIDLANGSSISGLVTDRTEIECDDGEGHHGEGHHPASEDGDDEPGDDEGGSGDEGEHGDEEGSGNDGEGACTVDDLVEDAVIHEAKIRIGGDGAVFVEIEIVQEAAA